MSHKPTLAARRRRVGNPNRNEQPSKATPLAASQRKEPERGILAWPGNTTLDATVAIFSVAVALVVVLSRVTDVGLTVQVTFALEDEGLQVRPTVPVKPLLAVTVMVDVPDCPGEEIVTLDGLANTA
jgi:hypothetical protein